MSLPHGPSQTPQDQTFHWFSRPYAYLDECAARFGETFTLNFQDLGPHVFTSNPTFIRNIFQGEPEQFLGGEGKEMLRPFLGDHSLLLTDGAPYQAHRKGLLPLFHSPWFDQWSQGLHGVVERWHVTAPREALVHEFCLAVSLEIISSAIFGREADSAEVSQVVLAFMSGVNFNAQAAVAAGGDNKAMEQLHRNVAELDGLIARERKRLKAKPDETSLLFEMEKMAEAAGWSEKEVRDEVATLLIAGHETTATSLAWILFELAKSPATLAKAMGNTDDRFWDGVIKEGMRLWPVIPVVARKLASPFTWEKWEFAAGTHLVPCIYLAHRRADRFPQPTVFDPTRFETAPSPFEYFPFGGGVRRCLGMGMAMVEMKAVLAQLFQKAEITFSGVEKVRPSRRSVAIIPSGPFRLYNKIR